MSVARSVRQQSCLPLDTMEPESEPPILSRGQKKNLRKAAKKAKKEAESASPQPKADIPDYLIKEGAQLVEFDVGGDLSREDAADLCDAVSSKSGIQYVFTEMRDQKGYHFWRTGLKVGRMEHICVYKRP